MTGTMSALTTPMTATTAECAEQTVDTKPRQEQGRSQEPGRSENPADEQAADP